MMISNDFELLFVEPCSPDECVFLKAFKNDLTSYILYEDVFKELHVQLPFMDFECEILSTLNVALVQFHPNSWAFL